jgi:hypothetical protein
VFVVKLEGLELEERDVDIELDSLVENIDVLIVKGIVLDTDVLRVC